MKQMTEIAIEVAELRAENKLLKSFNDSLLQALHKPVVVRPASAVERGGELLATEALDNGRSVFKYKTAIYSNGKRTRVLRHYFKEGGRF